MEHLFLYYFPYFGKNKREKSCMALTRKKNPVYFLLGILFAICKPINGIQFSIFLCSTPSLSLSFSLHHFAYLPKLGWACAARKSRAFNAETNPSFSSTPFFEKFQMYTQIQQAIKSQNGNPSLLRFLCFRIIFVLFCFHFSS